MDKLLEWLMENWAAVAGGMAIVFLIVKKYADGNILELANWLFVQLVAEAKEELVNLPDEVFEAAALWLYNQLPVWMKPFITAEGIKIYLLKLRDEFVGILAEERTEFVAMLASAGMFWEKEELT